jgi:fido (protein-threonine AMPylation protein)
MAWTPIPGETPIDPSGLLDPSIQNRRQLNAAEGRNIASAIFTYLLGELTPELAPFDFVWGLQLHREMFGQVWSWAGKTRKIDLNLGVPWTQVEAKLFDLFETIPYWKPMPILEQAARIHHGAVAIHPFENGNGRWSRMLANIWLRLNETPMTMWPEATIGDTSVIRHEYLHAVKAADDLEFAPLIELHQRYRAGS